MKAVFASLFLVLLTFSSFSQNFTTSQFSLNAITPSAEYEISVSGNSTIDLDLGVGFAYRRGLGGSDFGIYPGFETQYRYYYNFVRREADNRKISQNSANYMAVIASITSGDPLIGGLEYSSDYGLFVGPAWGLQRVYISGLKVNLNLGLGFVFNDLGESYFAPLLSVQLGWLVK